MSGLARQLASQYFGFQGAGQMQLGSMSAIGSAHASVMNQLTQSSGEWNPSEEACLKLAQEAGALETSVVVAKEYAKRLTEKNRALGQLTKVTGSYLQSAARQSLDNARYQNQMLKAAIPMAIQMGSEVHNHQGRVNGLQGSRLRSFG